MRSRNTRTAAATLAAPLLAGALAAPAGAVTAGSAADTASSAATAATGGSTRLIIAPGVAAALVHAGVVPLPDAPATASVTHGAAGPTVRYTFPITGGSLNLAKVSGAIGHAGGLHLYNLANKRSLTVQGFRVFLGDAP